MAVYLGSAGAVSLARVADGTFYSVMDPGDVSVSESRFSFDFPNGTFITGDRLEIARLNADLSPSTQLLDFADPSAWADGQRHPDGSWYVHVDALGGLRLYHSWADALEGSPTRALALTVPASSYKIGVSLETSSPNCLGEVLDYSFNTDREAIDVTALGDAFRERVSGIISGSGQIRAFWDWVPSMCNDSEVERAQYFHQLIMRQQLGSEFEAYLTIKKSFAEPISDSLSPGASAAAIYYKVMAVVTNVSMAFNPTSPLETIIQFVTTGPIELLYGLPQPLLILQENSSRIELESGTGFLGQEAYGEAF